MSGHFEPGDRLLEMPLSEHYSCGRAAVRSAIVALTSEGLVEREVNRGATVRRITVQEAIQITEARSALESLIAAKAARNATRTDCDELTEIIANMRAMVESDDGPAYSGLNALLHRRLQEMSGHVIAAQLVTNLPRSCRSPPVPTVGHAGEIRRVRSSARRNRRSDHRR